MNVRLVMAKGRPREHVIQLETTETVIGRHRECNLRVPSSDVSRRHCILRFQNGLLSVEDLDSTNGTYINGEKVTGQQVVQPGDLLEVGPVKFTVEYQATQTSMAAVPPLEEVDVLDVEEVEEDVVTLQDIDDPFDFSSPSKAPTAPPAKPKPEEEEPVSVEYDIDAEPLNLKNDGDLRDILSKLDG